MSAKLYSNYMSNTDCVVKELNNLQSFTLYYLNNLLYGYLQVQINRKYTVNYTMFVATLSNVKMQFIFK